METKSTNRKDLTFKIDNAHALKKRLEKMTESLEKTVGNMIPPPSLLFLVDIVKQVLIHEDLSEVLKVGFNRTSGSIFVTDKDDYVVCLINYREPR